MSKFSKFEEIKSWQMSRALVKRIYEITQRQEFSRDFSFRDQIRRSSLSAMSNIAEGFERYSNKEFARFLNIARASIAETKSQLYAAVDLNYIKEQEFVELKNECESISRHIWKLTEYLRKNP
jgi:four helix bundle protein